MFGKKYRRLVPLNEAVETRQVYRAYTENVSIFPAEETAESEDAYVRRTKILAAALQNALTERQREYVVMYYYEKKSQTEISQNLGVNQSSVSRTLAAARKRLENCLRYAM